MELDSATVLLVDDDPSTLDVFEQALTHAGFAVRTSVSGQSAIDVARQHAIDVMLVDLQLPDMSGLDVVRRTAAESRGERFVVVSGFLNVATSVQAMRLGAFDVLEKPVEIDRLLAVVRECVQIPVAIGQTAAEPGPIRLPGVDDQPASAAHRWAGYVRKACASVTDVRTLDDWARCAGVSYSTLCESCRIIGIRPQGARDFVRALRALIKSSTYHCEPSALLAVSDRRTLRVLLERAGPCFRQGNGTLVAQFMRSQRFVPSSNVGVRLLLGDFE